MVRLMAGFGGAGAEAIFEAMKQKISEMVFLGLGANLGDRRATMEQARRLLEEGGFKTTLASAFYETPPWGKTSQPPFINQVLGGSFAGAPMELLALAMEVEGKLGRERREVWGPRTLDIDILLFGRTVLRTQRLTVPHPFLTRRAFVLYPLAEIAPVLVPPGEQDTVSNLLAALPDDDLKGIVQLA